MAGEGITITREQFLSTFGLRNDSIIPRWLGSASNPEGLVRIGDAKEAMYRDLVRAIGMSPLPWVERWVRRLHEEGWRQAIASSAPRLNVEVVLDVTGLAGCFRAIVSAEDVRHGKPDPEVFLTAASRLGVPPERCIVIEDAAAGIEAAHRAGMRSIGVRHTGNALPAGGRAATHPPSDLLRLAPSLAL
jgi:beta-phosphoglucomutase